MSSEYFLHLQLSSVSRHLAVGVAEEEEGDEEQRVEMRLVQSDADDDAELEPNSDITALVQRYRHGYLRLAVYVCLCGIVFFTTGMHTYSHKHTHAHNCLPLFM